MKNFNGTIGNRKDPADNIQNWCRCELLFCPAEKPVVSFAMGQIFKKWCHDVLLSINTKLWPEEKIGLIFQVSVITYYLPT